MREIAAGENVVSTYEAEEACCSGEVEHKEVERMR